MLSIFIFALFFPATVALLAWLFIFFHPARPWDFQPVGDDAEIPPLPDGVSFPRVAIIVPARNESESLPRTLPALLKQDYAADYKIYLVDDRSTDNTAEIARQIARSENAEARLNVINGEALPQSWTGKVWALDQGAKASSTEGADFFLLTDADIFHAQSSLRRLVSESLNANLGMNS